MTYKPKTFVPDNKYMPKSFVPKEPNIPQKELIQVDDIPLDPNKLFESLQEKKTPQEIMNIPANLDPTISGYPSAYGLFSPETLGGRVLAKSPQIAGGTVGGMIGAAIPSIGEEASLIAGGSKLAQWGLGPLFAGLGGAAGRMATLNPNDPYYGRKLLFSALEEAGGEYFGRLLAAGAGRLFLRPFRGAVVPGAEAADQALRQAGRRTMEIPGIQPKPKTWIGKTKRGIARKIFMLGERIKDEPGAAYRLGKEYGAHYLPGQVTEGFGDTLQAVAEGSFFRGGSVLRHKTQTIPAAIENLQKRVQLNVKKNLIAKVGNKKAMAIMSDLSNADAKALRSIESALYKTIDDLADESIDITPLKELAESYMGKGLKPGARERMMRQVVKKPAQQGFEEIKYIRSDAWQEYEKFVREGEMNNARMAKEIAVKADNLMEQMAKRKGGALEAAWRTADEFHKGKLRVEWLSNTLAKYSKAEDVATGKGFINYIAKMTKEIDGKPSELARMGFTPQEINQIKEVAAATRFAAEPAKGGGRMLVQLMQARGIVELAGVPLAVAGMATEKPYVTAGGLAMIIGPSLLAQMMLSPTGSKLLSTGLRAPAGSRSVATLGVRLVREAAYHEAERRMKGQPPQLWLRYISVPRRRPIDVPYPAKAVGGHHF